MSESSSSLRKSGILLHPTSLPSPYGIGDLGPEAFRFIDKLASADQQLWQVLPLVPTGHGNSPYQSPSSFAGQPLLISPDFLIEDGLLKNEDLSPLPDFSAALVDYDQVKNYKETLLTKAFDNFQAGLCPSLISQYKAFMIQNSKWIEEYSLYMSIKQSQDDKAWQDWDLPYKNYTIKKKTLWKQTFKNEYFFHSFIQFLFYKQWHRLKDYANKNNIEIIGDLPIFVALDSADTWANSSLFQLDKDGLPLNVAGVPPDYFSETGQLWGNPLYQWKKHKKNKYAWWTQRISHQLNLCTHLRIDHFRGFESYWSVPAEETTAMNGIWVRGPGEDFFNSILKKLGGDLPLIAEDLGVITPQVEYLRDSFSFPGIKVLQFGFETAQEDSDLLPHNFVFNSICYTGTHDNNTSAGWFHDAEEETKDKFRIYMNTDGNDVSWDFIRAALGSVSRFAIFPMQDLLSKGEETRMNFPGTTKGNWEWRFTNEEFNDNIIRKLKKLTKIYGRSPSLQRKD